MKKRVKKLKVNRSSSHSKSILRNQLRSLLMHGKLETVEAKAKKLKSYADKNISYALKTVPEQSKSVLMSKLGRKDSVELILRYVEFLKNNGSDRSSGFTTITKTKYRSGDDSLMAEVRLLDYGDFGEILEKEMKRNVGKSKKKKKKKKKTEVQKKVEEKKEEQKGPEAKDDQDGFLDKIGGKILGRKISTKEPKGPKTSRTRARSGL